MATKQDLINEAVSKSWKGWYLITGESAPIPGADGKTLIEGTLNYAELVDGKVTKRNRGYYVYQSGEVDEDAIWRDPPKQKDTARAAVQTFLEGLTNVVRARIDELDEETLYGFATIWRTIDAATAEEVRVFVWKDEGQPISARELV
jgi:hypothetical protein